MKHTPSKLRPIIQNRTGLLTFHALQVHRVGYLHLFLKGEDPVCYNAAA